MGELNEYIKKQILRIFNIQKRKEISEKYHASFLSERNKSLPPEIEAEWLKYIDEFEQQFENANEIPLHEFIGSPIIKNIDDISINELESEYNRVVILLFENNIFVDFPDRLNISEKYRFISEELINEVIEDIHIQGMQLHFDYEEYHPNDNLN